MKMLALALVPLAFAEWALQPNVATEVPDKAIVLVVCTDRMGTAFHIGNGNYVTASHVVNGTKECRIGVNPARVLKDDSAKDVAELAGPDIGDRLRVDCGGFRPNRHYLATGYVGRINLVRLPLIYSAFGDDPDNGNGQFVGPDIIPGMSGGPLLNEGLRVSGVVLQRFPARARSLGETFVCQS